MITRVRCRACEGWLDSVFSLGEQYISNFLSPTEPNGPKAPLELALCRKCALVQLRHTVPGESMYQNYWYRSGTNQTMRNALAGIAERAESLVHLRGGDSVLDIGCNDGSLLASYKTEGIYKIGFDPAQNLSAFSRAVSSKTIVGFFDANAFESDQHLRTRRPRVVTSIAMFYDLEEPNKFVSDVKKVMDLDGLWIVQMSYLPLMLKQHDLGNICHEHLEYYSLGSLESLLRPHGLEVVDAELHDVNGGSLRCYIRNAAADKAAFAEPPYRQDAAKRLGVLRHQESKMGLSEVHAYEDFGRWIERIREDVTGFIREQAARGKKVYVYGASTKGNTMLQYFDLDHSTITAAADRNPDKWGKVTVGTRIPIVSEQEARAARPDYFLVLPFHFIDEFRERERDYLFSGGRFIVPLPHFTLI